VEDGQRVELALAVLVLQILADLFDSRGGNQLVQFLLDPFHRA